VSESYEVTLKVRVKANGKRSFGDNDAARAAWVLEGSQIIADMVDDVIGNRYYRPMNAEFEIVSSSAIPTTVVGVD